MCFYHDGDYPTVYRERDVKAARKARRCSDCGQRIHAGEPYLLIDGKWEGDFSSFATCERCQTLRAAIRRVEEEDGCRGSETQPALGALFDQVDDWGHYADEFLRLGLTDALALVPAPDPDDIEDALCGEYGWDGDDLEPTEELGSPVG